MISSSESNVNNWWESDGPMKGFCQGNELDADAKKKKNNNNNYFLVQS